jgi:hypothetical protein
MARYGLVHLYNNFHGTITDLTRIVTILASRQQSLERDVHIEGCFLRAVVTWENFIEAYFLRCMCSAKTRNGATLKPKTPCFTNMEQAFKRVKATNRIREQEYANWLSNVIIKQLVLDYFHHRSRLHRIYEDPDRLYALVTIRNAIAHRSKSAVSKFESYVINQHGYLANINPSMAELLITKNRTNSKLIFLDLTDYFDELAEILIK